MRYARTICLLITAYLLSSHCLLKDSPIVDIDEGNTELLAKQTIPTIPVGNFASYMDKMGKLESNNNYTAKNRFGYIGKYQFSKSTLRALVSKGYLDTTEKEIVAYRYLPELQERSMVALTRSNLDYLIRNDLLHYVGCTVGGVRITTNGLLAGMHLRGAYAVRLFLESNGSINMFDANNTTIKDYIKEFS